MEVFTYACAENAPEGAEFFARIRCEFTGFQGKRYEDWHPVLIPGATAAEARAKAEAWWGGELAKEEAAVARRLKQAGRMREMAATRRAAK